jgi:DNA topoisomerase-1
VDVAAQNHQGYLLRTAVSVNTFPGFMTLYSESKDEAEEDIKITLPPLAKGDGLDLIKIIPQQRFTQPPSRYTEATLVKALEQNGIGRPSTYAPIISTIQDREYVMKIKGGFQATELGMAVNDLLVQYFPDIINVAFTADMENKLDGIANNQYQWPDVIKEFYVPFDKDLKNAVATAEKVELEDEKTGDDCPKCGKPLVFKTGRFGKFVACSGYPECKYTQSFQVKTGVNCPKCGKEIVQRMSKRKKIFYGCSGYPECDFATYMKPLPEPCPHCGGLLTQARGKQAKCSNCEYKGPIPEKKPEETNRG